MITLEPNLNLILSLSTDTGSTHDFRIYKKEYKKKILPVIIANHPDSEHLYDSGFQGVQDLVKKSRIPIKKPRSKNKTKTNPKPEKTNLTKEQKTHNKQLSKERVPIENKNRELKIFRICKEIRRHKQKKHNQFWSTICGLVNLKTYLKLTQVFIYLIQIISIIGLF